MYMDVYMFNVDVFLRCVSISHRLQYVVIIMMLAISSVGLQSVLCRRQTVDCTLQSLVVNLWIVDWIGLDCAHSVYTLASFSFTLHSTCFTHNSNTNHNRQQTIEYRIQNTEEAKKSNKSSPFLPFFHSPSILFVQIFCKNICKSIQLRFDFLVEFFFKKIRTPDNTGRGKNCGEAFCAVHI